MTIDELSRMADECAADTANARRMMGGRYAQRAVRALNRGDIGGAKCEMVDAILHWPPFANALPDELDERPGDAN